MKKKKSVSGSASKGVATNTQALKRKFQQITKLLQDATEGQLARLLTQLLEGKRKISPDIELSELEAGILIENLDAHLRAPVQYQLCNVIWERG